MQTSPSHTEVCEDRDFVEWHRGCPWCAVWVLRVDTPPITHGVQLAREQLAPWLLPRYARQPHITVAYRGLMDAVGGYCVTEFEARHLQADVQALQHAQLTPFEVQVQGYGSFSTVPYVGVEMHPVLQQAYGTLKQEVPSPEWCYVPHVTLGHYGCQVPMASVLQALQNLDELVGRAVSVQALWLARYRTNDIAGALHWEGRFDLQTQQYYPQPDALWR